MLKGFFMSKINQFVLDANVQHVKTMYKNIIQDYKLSCETDEQGMYIQLVLIKIKKSQRRKGYGSAVMYELCALADSYNVRVKLWATNLYGSETKRLIPFYIKHGFVLIKNDDINTGEMLYFPKKTCTSKLESLTLLS
jgi:GNAT superfamily N-acetyltransferase